MSFMRVAFRTSYFISILNTVDILKDSGGGRGTLRGDILSLQFDLEKFK